MLPIDVVLKKDLIDVDCILHLTKDAALDELTKIGRVVHPLFPYIHKVMAVTEVGYN